MFSFFKKKKNRELAAVIDGKCIPLEEVKDPVFAEKALGEGIAIVPSGCEVGAPCSGVVSAVTPTKHAFGLTGTDGLEVMVHIGIDTVALNGEGFEVLCKVGDKVEKGQTLVRFDEKQMKEKKMDMTTMLILLNHDEYRIEKLYHNETVSKGIDTVIEYDE